MSPTQKSVFVTGCSAGSVGSITHAPYIIEQYPGVPVTQLGDSLAFVYHRPVNVQADYNAHDSFADWIPELQAITRGALIMSDVYSAVANYYPDYTFGQYNTEADNVQIRFYDAIGGNPDNFSADLATSLSNIHQNSPNFRSYTASGDLHCIMPRNQFYSTEIDGVSLTEWVTDLANNQPVSSVRCETCQNETELTAEVSNDQEPDDLLSGSWQEVGTIYDGKLYLFGGSPANAYQASNNSWVYDRINPALSISLPKFERYPPGMGV